MNKKIILSFIAAALGVLIGYVFINGGSGLAVAETAKPSQVVIGLSLDTLKEQRWQTDRELFIKRANELGAKVLDLAANSDDTTQIGDIEKLITNKVNVIVIVPHDSTAMAKAVKMAHDADIPVIAYDRIIKDSDLDLYVSFENRKVGEQQAQYLVDTLPNHKGRIVRIFGAKTDNNAGMLKDGQDEVFKPYVDRGDIVMVHEDWAEEWKPENAKRIVNAAITANGTKFDAVLASNDGTAGGAIQALTEEGVAGKIIVTGQDADLVALQRIAAGTQSMTIYKPLKVLASKAAEAAIKLAKHEPIVAKQSVNNGKIDVPAILSPTIVVTKDNIVQTVVKDGMYAYDDIYGSIPKDKRPPLQ
jgi:D-xylose transport system substrate-binding protein